uniref:Uncharacterized protein n=1 Tax=Timema cristinae TaxID=61476 RepID=A0A7R9DCA6_TIMCR|nr:unnamed protein product [Timema cristinae]
MNPLSNKCCSFCKELRSKATPVKDSRVAELWWETQEEFPRNCKIKEGRNVLPSYTHILFDMHNKDYSVCLIIKAAVVGHHSLQIGHEPIPPYPTKTIFGKPALALPNVFKYVLYIKSVDGFIGIYRGLAPKLCSNAISGFTFHKVSDALRRNTDDKSEQYVEDEELSEEQSAWLMLRRRCVQTRVGRGRKKVGKSVPATLVAIEQKDVQATLVAMEQNDVPAM